MNMTPQRNEKRDDVFEGALQMLSSSGAGDLEIVQIIPIFVLNIIVIASSDSIIVNNNDDQKNNNNNNNNSNS